MHSETMSNMTKTLFSDALKKNLKKKSIAKITIQELALECGLSRRTFYRYFKDIYDLLEYLYQSEIQSKIEPYMDFDHWKEGLFDVFNYFYLNQEVSISIIKYSRRDYLEKFLNNIFKDSISPIMEREPHFHILLEDEKEFLIKFYTLSFTTLLIDWIDGGMTIQPKKIIDYIWKILSGSINRISDR